MSEEQTEQTANETKADISNKEISQLEAMDAPKISINERLNHAYIAKEYTLLNGGSDNIIMIQASRDGFYPIDVLLTFEGIEEVVNQLRPDAIKKTEEQLSDGGNEQ